MRKTVRYNIIILLAMTSTACSKSPIDGEADDPNIPKEITLEVQIDNDQWSYVSLSNGEVVGYSDFFSSEEDEAWALRDDWDIAFCNGFIRTNSGTSGTFNGGIILDDSSYINTNTAPTTGYLTDIINGGSD